MYHSYEDLEVWKRSVDVAVRLYGILGNCRDYGLKDQMLRSAVSVPSNVAEGAERDSKKDFVRFLRISKGSAAELRTQLHIAEKANVVNARSCATVRAQVTEISKNAPGSDCESQKRQQAMKPSDFKLKT